MIFAQMTPAQIAQWRADQKTLQAHSDENAGKMNRRAIREAAIDQLITRFPALAIEPI